MVQLLECLVLGFCLGHGIEPCQAPGSAGSLLEILSHSLSPDIWCVCMQALSTFIYLFIYSFIFLNFYLFMIVTEREKSRDTGRGRSRLHAPGARCGIRSQASRIAPWAKGRRQTAAPPRDPYLIVLREAQLV